MASNAAEGVFIQGYGDFEGAEAHTAFAGALSSVDGQQQRAVDGRRRRL
jgi:hypothetical protein